MRMTHDDLVALLVGYMTQKPSDSALGQVYDTLHAVTDALQHVADPTIEDQTDDRMIAYYAASQLEEVVDDVQNFVEGP